MKRPRFWPLDFDPEGEIYDNLAWDLPGYKPNRPQPYPSADLRRRKKSRRA